MKPSIREQLLRFLQTNEGTHASGSLQRMEWRNRNGSLSTPRSIVRRLEELCEEGFISVEYRNNHAYYSAIKSKIPPRYTYQYDEGRKVVVKMLVS